MSWLEFEDANWEMWMLVVVGVICLGLFGCGGAVETAEPIPEAPADVGPYWHSWREQFPDLSAEMTGCIRLLVQDSPGCSVAAPGGEPAQCVATQDPMIVRAEPNLFCTFGADEVCDCEVK